MTHTQIAAIYAVCCALILAALSVRCIRMRFKHKAPLGHGGNEEMERAMRVHANAAEHIPIVLIMIVLLAALQASVLFIHLAGIALVVGRALHAFGFSRISGPSRGRFFGQVLTFTAYLIAIVGLIFSILR